MELMVRCRRITEQDVKGIQTLTSQHGHRGRHWLAQEICRQWRWAQANGEPKLRACHDLLGRLEARGLLVLPARRAGSIAPRRKWRLPLPVLALELEMPAGDVAPAAFGAIQWRLAMPEPEARLYRDLIHRHHYLGYRPPIGSSLRYIAWAQDRPIACIGWAAAAWKVAVRDQFIGWKEDQRQAQLPYVVNNTRFLMLERRPHLASHLLAKNVRALRRDWSRHYGIEPVLLETFVDTTRFKGTVYKAANWTYCGQTQGRGKYDRHTRRPATVKAVFVYPFCPGFRSVLCQSSEGGS